MVDEVSGDTPGGTGAESVKRSAADTFREEAGRIGSQAAERARSFAAEGKDRTADALGEVSKMMENAAGEVDQKLGPEYGKYARSAAQGISGFADSLKGKQIEDQIGRAHV